MTRLHLVQNYYNRRASARVETILGTYLHSRSVREEEETGGGEASGEHDAGVIARACQELPNVRVARSVWIRKRRQCPTDDLDRSEGAGDFDGEPAAAGARRSDQRHQEEEELGGRSGGADPVILCNCEDPRDADVWGQAHQNEVADSTAAANSGEGMRKFVNDKTRRRQKSDGDYNGEPGGPHVGILAHRGRWLKSAFEGGGPLRNREHTTIREE